MGCLMTELDECWWKRWREGFSEGVHRLFFGARLVGVKDTGHESADSC